MSARFQTQHLIYDALVGSETDRVSEKARNGAKFASIGAAASGLDGNEVELFPLDSIMSHDGAEDRGNSVELIEIERLPRDLRVSSEIGFAILTESVDRRVHIFQLAAHRIPDNLRPCLIGFPESDGVSMPRSTAAPKRFVRPLRDVGAAHHYFDSGGAQSVCRPVSSLN